MIFKKNTSNGVTSEIRIKRCFSCGAILQDNNPNDEGYISKERLNTNEEDLLCERCYKLRHYSSPKTNNFNSDFATILLSAKEENALGVYVLNAFSLLGSIIDSLPPYLPNNLLVIINKRDVLPKTISDSYLINQVENIFNKQKLSPKKILITSASDSQKIKEILDSINSLRKGKNVYFFGAVQVGKSSLVNEILKNYTNETSKLITTSLYPNTSLNVISIPIDKNTYIYDTPGIENPSSIISYVEPSISKFIQPRKEVKIEEYSAKEDQSFLISNFARVDFVSGSKASFSFYKSNDISIYRTKINKANKLIESFTSKNDTFHSNLLKNENDYTLHSFNLTPGAKYIIRIFSLCIITVSGEANKIDVYAPKKVSVTLEAFNE